MAKLITILKLLPKKHQILLFGIILVTLIILLIPSDKVAASKQTREHVAEPQAFEVPLAFRTPNHPNGSATASPEPVIDANALTPPTAESGAVVPQPTVQEAPPPAPVEKLHTEEFVVKKGDSLAALFDRAGLSARQVHYISQLDMAKRYLLKIMPGDQISIIKNDKNQFVKLEFAINNIETLEISKITDDDYKQTIHKKTIELKDKYASATITSNFWNAAVTAGLTPNQIMQLATIFGWDVDFALDIRKGDKFSLIYQQEYSDGKFIGNGDILAAEFTNQGEQYTAIRYTDGKYYSKEGRSMRKAFLRSPVDFTRVSSNFNPRRLHPVTGQVKAHRGVDYVAPIGTPIKAAGSGRVIKSAYNQYNGNYVFIKHNDTYTTKYLHLTKRMVKTGQSVKQGQVIGTLGKTGRVTGAHLHYEFIVNGVHRNPRTITLPKANPIGRSQREKFAVISKEMMAELNRQQLTQMAAK